MPEHSSTIPGKKTSIIFVIDTKGEFLYVKTFSLGGSVGYELERGVEGGDERGDERGVERGDERGVEHGERGVERGDDEALRFCATLLTLLNKE